jgi:hypothetical protein
MLIAVHLSLGTAMALTVLVYPGLQEWALLVVLYAGVICSDILLLGLWLGFSAARAEAKVAALMAGVLWLVGLSIAPAPNRPAAFIGELVIFMSVPIAVAAGSSALCGRWLARVELRSQWASSTIPEELRFSLNSLLFLILAIAVLLGVGRFSRSIGDVFQVVLAIFALTALLATGMLVWATLGPGQPLVRVPTIISGMTLLGLLPPYAMNGPSFRYFIWPSLLAAVAVIAASSLLVVRSCGYRLVRIRLDIDQ